ncbi:hypothetical protein ACFLVJ_00650 [Chloroflexota bacterium]
MCKTKKVTFLATLALLVTGIIASGCSPEEPATGEMEIRLAPIEEVQLSIAESFPPQYFLYIRGGLADSCTSFHEVEVDRNGNAINIETTTRRPINAICTQVYSTFEENIALGSDFTSGATYTVEVNDFKPVTFVAQ